MRVFSISAAGVSELDALPAAPPADGGFLWIACARDEFAREVASTQAALQRLCGLQLVDLHVSDLLNAQLPSRYDYTAQYDLMVFRRLATGSMAQAETGAQDSPAAGTDAARTRRSGPPILRRIDTRPVGFAVFDNLLFSVHPNDCAVRDTYAARLLASTPAPGGGSGERPPASAPELMLRITSQVVDGYLALRRDLTRQLDHWQTELLAPRTRFTNWNALLEARLTLHALLDISEDQRTALLDWITALENWPETVTPSALRERDLLKVRSRDVLEHVERVVRHVQRLEQNAETTLQMHFSAQGHRANEIMRTLTVLTAIFLPLNLITGFFGMNFDFLPLVHRQSGLLWVIGIMVLVALVFVGVFWRKRYIARTPR